MNLIKVVVFVLALSVVSGDCVAELPTDDRLFGQGRLLKRIRNRIRGESPNDARKESKEKEAKKSDSRKKSVSPKKKPTLADKKAKSESGIKKETTEIASNVLSGFGIQIDVKDDAIYVAKLAKSSSAATAGLLKKDKIVEAAGLTINSPKVLEDIAQSLRNGDQIEFVVERKKESKKFVVPFVGSTTEKPESAIARAKDSVDPQWNPTLLAPNWDPLEKEPASAIPASDSAGFSVLEGAPRSANVASNTVFEKDDIVAPKLDAVEQRAIEAERLVERQRLRIEKIERELQQLKAKENLPSDQEEDFEIPSSVLVPNEDSSASGPIIKGPVRN